MLDANGNEIPAIVPVVFDEKQQEKVNQLIREKQGEAAREVRTQLAAKEAEATTLAADLAAARADLAKAKTPSAKLEAKEEVAELLAQMSEMKVANNLSTQEAERAIRESQTFKKEAQDAKSETMKVRKEVAIQKAAAKSNFIDLGIVSKLTEDAVRWDADKNTFSVISESGGVRLNPSLDPMTLDDLYKEFAASNPYLVRPDARGGSGSSQNSQGLSSNGKYDVAQIFGKDADSRVANKLALENIKEYQRLKAVAQENGLIPRPVRAR